MFYKFIDALWSFGLRWFPPLMVLNFILCTHKIVVDGFKVSHVVLWILAVFYLTMWCDRNSEFIKEMEK
ncbi:hypothetical protein [Stenotrophomonas phage RAS14]